MPAYGGFQKKKNPLGTTLAIVALVHIAAAGGLVWLSTTQFGRELIEVYKIKLAAVKEKPPEPPKPPEPEPPPPEPEVAPPPPAPEPAPVEVAQAPEPVVAPPAPASRPVSLPGFGNPFGGSGKRGRFAGYVDIVTAEIQRRYIQPPELPEDMSYAVLCQLLLDEEGNVISYKLVNSSGNELFDRSALKALASIDRLRPPPQEMSRTIVVKFYPPT
jgi:protein TonB